MPNHTTSKAINAALLKRFGAEFEIDPELTIRRKKWWNAPAWAP